MPQSTSAQVPGVRACCRKYVPVRCVLAFVCVLSAACFWPGVAVSQETPVTSAVTRHESRWTIVEAEDATCCRIEGKHDSWIYPRGVGRQSVALFEGSQLSISNDARAVYLRLPAVFASPGPRYGDFADARLRVRIDERPWQEPDTPLAHRRPEYP